MSPDANDPIADYIRANRDKYTREAIREQLLAAGHTETAIDDAWRRVEGQAAADAPGTTARKVRTGWAIALFLIGLLIPLINAVNALVSPTSNQLFFVLFVAFYSVAGFFVLRWISRWRPLSGFGQLMVAIVGLPLLFVALLFGTCVAALPGLAIQ